MVFYFTATGNSLYATKQLDKNTVSIPRTKPGIFEDETIGIVCPVFGGEMPELVLDFIKESSFITPYLYMILTYGHDATDSAEYSYNQCRQFGKTFQYINNLLMVDNYLPGFDIAEETAKDKKIPEQIAHIKNDIESRRKYIPEADKRARAGHRMFRKMSSLMPSLTDGSAIQMTDRCYGCGICSKVCPTGNITLRDGKAERESKTCLFCLACVHACPGNAITLKKEKNRKARFRNENITLTEIVNSNNIKEY